MTRVVGLDGLGAEGGEEVPVEGGAVVTAGGGLPVVLRPGRAVPVLGGVGERRAGARHDESAPEIGEASLERDFGGLLGEVAGRRAAVACPFRADRAALFATIGEPDLPVPDVTFRPLLTVDVAARARRTLVVHQDLPPVAMRPAVSAVRARFVGTS